MNIFRITPTRCPPVEDLAPRILFVGANRFLLRGGEAMTFLKALISLLLATPSRVHYSVGVAAGEGGWDLEDSNHYRKK